MWYFIMIYDIDYIFISKNVVLRLNWFNNWKLRMKMEWKRFGIHLKMILSSTKYYNIEDKDIFRRINKRRSHFTENINYL